MNKDPSNGGKYVSKEELESYNRGADYAIRRNTAIATLLGGPIAGVVVGLKTKDYVEKQSSMVIESHFWREKMETGKEFLGDARHEDDHKSEKGNDESRKEYGSINSKLNTYSPKQFNDSNFDDRDKHISKEDQEFAEKSDVRTLLDKAKELDPYTRNGTFSFPKGGTKDVVKMDKATYYEEVALKKLQSNGYSEKESWDILARERKSQSKSNKLQDRLDEDKTRVDDPNDPRVAKLKDRNTPKNSEQAEKWAKTAERQADEIERNIDKTFTVKEAQKKADFYKKSMDKWANSKASNAGENMDRRERKWDEALGEVQNARKTLENDAKAHRDKASEYRKMGEEFTKRAETLKVASKLLADEGIYDVKILAKPNKVRDDPDYFDKLDNKSLLKEYKAKTHTVDDWEFIDSAAANRANKLWKEARSAKTPQEAREKKSYAVAFESRSAGDDSAQEIARNLVSQGVYVNYDSALKWVEKNLT